MSVVTATEFKTKLGYYLDKVAEEDVIITRQGRVTARLSAPSRDRLTTLNGLVGIIAESTMTADDARAERLASR